MANKRLLPWGSAILLAGIGGYIVVAQLGLTGANEASLKVSNQSSAEITQISVVLYEKPCQIERLGPAESALCTFRIESDAHYRISWMEANASSYQEAAGYVTQGFDFRHALRFLGAGIISFSELQ
jgi:hypothetical protein